MTPRNAARPRVCKGQKPRISVVSWLTLACFLLATVALLWTWVLLLGPVFARSSP